MTEKPLPHPLHVEKPQLDYNTAKYLWYHTSWDRVVIAGFILALTESALAYFVVPNMTGWFYILVAALMFAAGSSAYFVWEHWPRPNKQP